MSRDKTETAIVLTPQTKALQQDIVEAEQQIEVAAKKDCHDPAFVMSGIAAVSGIALVLGDTLGAVASNPVAFVLALGGVGVAGLGMRVFLYKTSHEDQAKAKAEKLKKQFADECKAATERLQSQSMAIIEHVLDDLGHLDPGQILPLEAEDGSRKILRILSYEQGRAWDKNAPVSSATVTAQLCEAVQEGDEVKPGAVITAMPEIKYVRREALRM